MAPLSVLVLSAKGGTAKTLWQLTLAGEASRAGIPTLLLDVDPERNLSNRLRAPARTGGLAAALSAAGVGQDGEAWDLDAGAKVLRDELMPTGWDHVDLIPAGPGLTVVGQTSIADMWLLRELLEAADLFGEQSPYRLVLLDTGGRSGTLTNLALYAGDVAYAPIAPTTDSIVKAGEARERVRKIQRSHPLRWAGVVLSGFDLRTSVDAEIREAALARFGEQVRAEVPRRVAVHEAFQTVERLGDRPDARSADLAGIFGGFLAELMDAR